MKTVKLGHHEPLLTDTNKSGLYSKVEKSVDICSINF